MKLDFIFFLNNILLGIGLAMDAFSVSMANGMNEPSMHPRKMLGVSGIFGFFQALMPMIGWICVHTVVQYFQTFEKMIPWIALVLLCYIGGKMLLDGLHPGEEEEKIRGLTFHALLIQGIATAIDALSVGFTIAEYNFGAALLASAIIALVTWGICYVGLIIGKTVGNKLANKASILGGAILIIIGIEIFLTGIL